ncbi:hypothetical protein MTO96_003768 [Rhipicephalus appendiculatus]
MQTRRRPLQPACRSPTRLPRGPDASSRLPDRRSTPGTATFFLLLRPHVSEKEKRAGRQAANDALPRPPQSSRSAFLGPPTASPSQRHSSKYEGSSA